MNIKRLLFIIIMILSLAFSTMNVNAQTYNTQWYKTTAFSSQTYNYYTNEWNNWSTWEKSNVSIKFDLNNDVIVIYSPKTQVYSLFDVSSPYNDVNGGQQIKFSAYDDESIRVDIRLRIEKNGNSQIYVDYANIRWVYNVIRTQ